jgi:hypothetical protein
MAKCAYCGSTIIMGGKKDGDLTFCNDTCLAKGMFVRVGQKLPEDIVQRQVAAIHQSNCPKCKGSGPVDIHISYRIWSALVLTRWSNRAELCCRSCGVKNKLVDSAICLFFGWWGIPWGVVMTPVQLVKNIAGIVSIQDPGHPSDALNQFVRANLAAAALKEQRAQQASTGQAINP